MKASLAIIIVCSLAAPCLGQVAGGYREIAVTDKDVKAAADFAIEAHSKKEKVALVKIVKAEVQVVAGRNFKLTLEVRRDGKARQAEAVVWAKLDRTYELTRWQWQGEPRSERQPPMTKDETRAFMKELAEYVVAHHLRKDSGVPQRGMIYEYFDVKRRGESDQWVQGEALDTMHDGAWFAAALVNAYRATGDAYYKELLTGWVLPFYCKMLNHSDTLFSTKRNDGRPGAHQFDKEHRLQDGEKGFVPYWWDDGASVSLERRRDKNPLGPFACTDFLAGKPNPQFRLEGYSHGSSNHLAQDLGVMLLEAWLLLRESPEDGDRKLAGEVAEAARNLHECRMRHHGHIPMCDAPAALALGNAKLMKYVPDQSGPTAWQIDNHYVRALYEFKPGQRYALPGFADDQEYRYYAGLARHAGKLPAPLAFRTIYDAFTEPMLYRYYCDDEEPSPGINRFDLHPYYAKDGRLEDYRSDRKGPSGRPRPEGSRMGPQNMVCSGWALQVLQASPGIWEERHRRQFAKYSRVALHDPTPGTENDIVWTPLTFESAKVEVSARRYAFVLRVRSSIPEGSLALYSRPDAQGSHALIRYRGDRDVRVENDQAQPLFYRRFDLGPDGGFLVYIPYSVVKQQTPWANGIEHGRYSLRVGQQTVNLYVASPEAQVRAWLAHDLGGGLRTWQAIFRSQGYIPTGIGAGDWDRFSDSGGYAHLLSAASQWLLYLDGKNDWELQRVPAVLIGDKK
jgi:hypothetical protein